MTAARNRAARRAAAARARRGEPAVVEDLAVLASRVRPSRRQYRQVLVQIQRPEPRAITLVRRAASAELDVPIIDNQEQEP